MKSNKWAHFFGMAAIVGVGYAGTFAVKATEPESEKKEVVDTRPTIAIQSAQSQEYRVELTGYGEVVPVESTNLAAQVTGEVVEWSENFVTGGLVSRGEVLFSIEKDQYEAALLQAQANLLRAEASLTEEQARATVAKKEARRLTQDKVTDLYLRKPQVMSAQAAVKSAQSALKLAQRDLDNCTVVAPFDAVVVSRSLGMGQMVMQGAAVAQLNNIERADVIFPVANFDRPFLPETLANASADVALSSDASVSRKGFIKRDLGVVQSGTRMLRLVAEVVDPYGLNSNKKPLHFGSFVKVKYNGKRLNDIYRLPQEMVVDGKVWIVEDGKIFAREVTVLREENQYFLIEAGLNNGEQLATSVPDYPQNGMEIVVAEAVTNVSMTSGE